MKTKEYEIIFTKEDVQSFVQLIGEQNLIYQSPKGAKDDDSEPIPLPPTMPMMAYKWLETPLELQQPMIHRKQKCIQHQRMYIGEIYRAIVEVTNPFQRQNLTFIKQTLYLYRNDGQLCFEGVSDLILGGLT
ncbi:FAS1-like dehydratase domain-containing protein [Neobacillus cucumis]|uniref:FAS1-like dehydratase domain-containing protein n=1 Tax=Neobacillus cucumis TaxID=1740721 RepID=UPI0028536476|nr:MaoC family dehydratase N-terminal domain-containing protein [Neobacillus cucumis]MDR4949809.1 MaoC family dehydratase N-terminal domain-containing protein [Neobacillus cucumis]